MNRNKIIKSSAAVLLAFSTGCAVSAEEIPAVKENTAPVVEEQAVFHSGDDGKEETVYIIGDAEGNPKSVIVSDWLKNGSGADSLSDETGLSDIKNVGGDEVFHVNTDGTITWDAAGSDIYYQGTTDQELPVNVKISYTLDGQPVSASEIAGKSGHVKIRFDYENKAEKTVEINGKTETVKVPFAMVSGTILSQECFSNIKVTNGKLISEGTNAIVFGMAYPGLKESLNLSDMQDGLDLSKIEIPDYVEIEADAKNFKLDTTMTVASANLLNELNMDEINTGDLKKDRKSVV